MYQRMRTSFKHLLKFSLSKYLRGDVDSCSRHDFVLETGFVVEEFHLVIRGDGGEVVVGVEGEGGLLVKLREVGEKRDGFGDLLED